MASGRDYTVRRAARRGDTAAPVEVMRLDGDLDAQVLRLLEAALEQAPAARAAWLERQDATAEVRTRVRTLLAGEAAAEGFRDRPVELAATHRHDGVAALPQTRVGAWRIVRELDAGGMGVVYLGERADGAYEQQVAIKLMRVAPWASEEERRDFAARFDNERRLLARVEHPNVARILDGGSTADGVPYLVMEYVDGVSLTRWCDERKLDVVARLALFCKVCDGVQAAHRHLIVHRDLKPGNILVGSDGQPRLLDFGIARTLDLSTRGIDQPTMAGAMTPAYASPEQVRHEPLTTASDVYSLGVVLYELISGRRPYSLDGLSPAQSERVVCDAQPPTLRRALGSATMPDAERRARMAGIRGDLERIVAKALHKDPARRYESASMLGEDLRCYLQGRPVQAHPDSVGYRAARFVRRHRLGTAAAAIAFAAILGASVVALLQARHARQAAADTLRVNAFLLDLINFSNPYDSGGEPTLAAAVDAALGNLDAHFVGRPDLTVELRNALGQSLYGRYQLDAAQAQLERARADGERLFGVDDARVITAISALANVRKEQDRGDEAKALFEEALRRIERSGKAGSTLHVDVLNDLGVMYLVYEDYALARQYLQQAVDLDRSSDSKDSLEDRARTLASLAQAYRGLGDLARADQLYGMAQPILEQAYPEGSPHLAVILNNRARVAALRDDLPRAIQLQQRAVAMQQRAANGDHAMVLVPTTNLARMALDSGQLELAERSAQDAVAMAERMYPKQSHFYEVNALAVLAAVRMRQGRQTDAAVLLERARTRMAGLNSVPPSVRDFVTDLITNACEGKRPASQALCKHGTGGKARPAQP
ncbi:MAG: serine/threonine protein kinase [Dokdonella sp.]|nr:MAG: serine/threonine protein kinase [Dokdonella sp.]